MTEEQKKRRAESSERTRKKHIEQAYVQSAENVLHGTVGKLA